MTVGTGCLAPSRGSFDTYILLIEAVRDGVLGGKYLSSWYTRQTMVPNGIVLCGESGLCSQWVGLGGGLGWLQLLAALRTHVLWGDHQNRGPDHCLPMCRVSGPTTHR